MPFFDAVLFSKLKYVWVFNVGACGWSMGKILAGRRAWGLRLGKEKT